MGIHIYLWIGAYRLYDSLHLRVAKSTDERERSRGGWRLPHALRVDSRASARAIEIVSTSNRERQHEQQRASGRAAAAA